MKQQSAKKTEKTLDASEQGEVQIIGGAGDGVLSVADMSGGLGRAVFAVRAIEAEIPEAPQADTDGEEQSAHGGQGYLRAVVPQGSGSGARGQAGCVCFAQVTEGCETHLELRNSGERSSPKGASPKIGVSHFPVSGNRDGFDRGCRDAANGLIRSKEVLTEVQAVGSKRSGTLFEAT